MPPPQGAPQGGALDTYLGTDRAAAAMRLPVTGIRLPVPPVAGASEGSGGATQNLMRGISKKKLPVSPKTATRSPEPGT